MRAVDALANQSYDEMKSRESGIHQPDADYINHETVLKALKRLDPVGSKNVLESKAPALEEFMDKIRLPCVKFIENIDPSVKLYRSKYHYSKISDLHYYLNSCRSVVNNWKSILENALSSYHSYL